MAHEMLQDGDAFDYTNPTTALLAGEFVLNSTNAVILGLTPRPMAVGEYAGVCRKPGMIVNCDKAAAVVFALGDAANFVVATKLATSAAIGAGVIALGRCVEAAGNGPVKVKIAVNFL